MMKRKGTASLFWILLVLVALASGGWWLLADPPQAVSSGNLTVGEAMANSDTLGYERALAVRPFRFPADHGPHAGFKTEWWYYTGNLVSKSGRRFGFQLTFFRSALMPKGTLPERASTWAAQDLYMGHFALSDIQEKRFFSFERFARGDNHNAGAQATPVAVWLEDWELRSRNASGIFPTTVHAAQDGVVLYLSVDSLKPLVLQGERGLSRKSAQAGNASYYYSYPRMSAKGYVVVQGDTFAVDGTSWMDREWSTSALSTEQVGWDWFSLQLEDNTELMYYQLRKKDGTPDVSSSGSAVDAQGRISGIAFGEAELKVTNWWTHPKSKVRYPAQWTLTVPKDNLTLQITPQQPDQELQTSIRYWEGAVTLSGTRNGKPVKGVGYVELTGYDAEMAGRAR